MQTLEDLPKLLKEWSEPSFRLKQVFDWIFAQGVSDVDQMTNLSKGLRNRLKEQVNFSPLERVRLQESDDRETTKYLWKLSDGALVESVLIRSGDRRTVCVSSQIGCPAKCAFCASGKKGFMRNLTAGEIVDQVVQSDRDLKEIGERVSHVVFMGMGEPLRNLPGVLPAIDMITSQLGISQRRITVSTVGVIEGIEEMIKADLKVSLVLSLHAPNQHVRKKIIPYARQYDLVPLLETMQRYRAQTGRDVTYEYILISELNDEPEHAEELAHLVKGQHCTVNLIPYNPIPGVRLERPTGERIAAFRRVLDRHRTVNTCRYTKGSDIAAACGQLALQESL